MCWLLTRVCSWLGSFPLPVVQPEGLSPARLAWQVPASTSGVVEHPEPPVPLLGTAPAPLAVLPLVGCGPGLEVGPEGVGLDRLGRGSWFTLLVYSFALSCSDPIECESGTSNRRVVLDVGVIKQAGWAWGGRPGQLCLRVVSG